MVGEQFPAHTRDPLGERGPGSLESGGHDNNVEIVGTPPGRDHRVTVERRERRGFERHRRPHQRRVELVTEKYSLATDFIVRRQSPAEIRIVDLGSQMPQRPGPDLIDVRPEPSTLRKCFVGLGEELFPQAVCVGLHLQLHTLGFAVFPITSRHHIGRAAGEDDELPGTLSEVWRELYRRCPRAHDADACAVDRSVVIPLGGVENLAGECVRTGYLGHERIGQPADRHDEHAGPHLARVGRHEPAELIRKPSSLCHIGVQMQVRRQTLLVHRTGQILVDLRPRREQRGPVTGRPERIRVDMCGYVACDARVMVVPPRAAHRIAAFEDDKALPVGPGQPDTQAESREPGTDDRHVDAVWQ